MANTVDGLILNGRGTCKYPWNEWANGATWFIEAGKDYTVSTKSFVGAAWAHAYSRGIGLRTQTADGGVYLQFVLPAPKRRKKLPPRLQALQDK